MSKYYILYKSKKPIYPGRCIDCPQHFVNIKPKYGESSTGCGLTGELIPDEWNTEEKPWDKCPVVKCESGQAEEREK